jgi:tetratricopeptide (TPR) repeat protein
VKKPNQRGPVSSASLDALAARAAEALKQQRFKEAVELFKPMVRQDPRPEWKQSLAEAYRGRARALAAKKMFKEAAMVVENTLGPNGTLADPVFYLHCLIRDGQHQKAAAHVLQYVGTESTLPAEERAILEDLAAALLVAVPLGPGPARAPSSEQARWLELAAASREALAAWVAGASAQEVERQLNRISLRSAFRPVRVLLKCLITMPQDADRSRQLLEAIPPGSPFFAFREAVAAVLAERALDADGWHRLTPVQQAFVAQMRNLPGTAVQFLARSAEAARSGPSALFGFLLKQPDLPQAEVRSACLNLLPQMPDRLSQFEKRFGPLPDFERHRIQALAAEGRGDWAKAERFWRAAVAAISLNDDDDRQARLSRGVILRHLAQLAAKHPEIEGDGDGFDDPVISYLERSCQADPDYVTGVLELIGHYRADARLKDWHRLVDEAVQRFPDNSALLLQATESAMARNAYKKAAGFARRLLKIDPINSGVRRQMIELQVAHARKQMRAGRPELAAKELAAAAEWERPDAPSAPLRIAQALVELRAGQDTQAQERLRAGVALAGSGVAGWFRAALEGELMKLTGSSAGLLHQELTRARETPPTKEAVMAIVSALGQPAASEKRAVASLLLGMRAWLQQAAVIDWLPAEFQAIAEILVRFDAFDVVAEYARTARRREPGNPIWRFHEIVARTRGNPTRLTIREMEELGRMADAAVDREDFHAANRIERFLSGDDDTPSRRRRSAAASLDTLDDVPELFAAMLEGMPKGATDSVRVLVREFGWDGAVAHMVEQARATPGGPGMPDPVLRELCQAMVAMVMNGSRPRQAPTARRSRP